MLFIIKKTDLLELYNYLRLNLVYYLRANQTIQPPNTCKQGEGWGQGTVLACKQILNIKKNDNCLFFIQIKQIDSFLLIIIQDISIKIVVENANDILQFYIQRPWKLEETAKKKHFLKPKMSLFLIY